MITVGEFTYDAEASTISGPAAYMEERGNARIAEIQAGRDPVFNFGASGAPGSSPNPETAMLVSLQTDYAGWLGQKAMESRLNSGPLDGMPGRRFYDEPRGL